MLMRRYQLTVRYTSSTRTQHEDKFLSGGPVFGIGPDLHINLENHANCISQLGSTYELPKACAVTNEGPAFLSGYSPFEALDVAAIQMVDAQAINAAAREAARKAERLEVPAQ